MYDCQYMTEFFAWQGWGAVGEVGLCRRKDGNSLQGMYFSHNIVPQKNVIYIWWLYTVWSPWLWFPPRIGYVENTGTGVKREEGLTLAWYKGAFFTWAIKKKQSTYCLVSQGRVGSARRKCWWSSYWRGEGWRVFWGWKEERMDNRAVLSLPFKTSFHKVEGNGMHACVLKIGNAAKLNKETPVPCAVPMVWWYCSNLLWFHSAVLSVQGTRIFLHLSPTPPPDCCTWNALKEVQMLKQCASNRYFSRIVLSTWKSL